MRLPGRLAAAIDVLAEVESRGRPVSEALKAWGLANRFAGAGDRAAIGNLVYDALRRRASHAFAMGSDTPRALVLSVAVRDWGETPDALAASFAGDRFAPAPPTEDEIARLTAADPLAGAPEHVRADVPEWTLGSLAYLGDVVAEGQAMAERPPLDLRVNSLKSDRERVAKSLRRFEIGEPELSPLALRLAAGRGDARTPNVTSDEGYLKGWFEVQDLGSQVAASLTGAVAGEQVLDLCAGAGGKTLAMAAAMGNKGQIFAYDEDRTRLAPIYDRLQRNGARNVQVRAPDTGALDDLVGRMDRVVLDAPCTGTGTWRRRPDTKWKLTPEQVAARQDQQWQVLEAGARYVRPGGTLVYITCSLLADENGNQIVRFLGQHPEFVSETLALEGAHQGAEGGLTLTPYRTGTDGFYVVRLVRAG